MATANNAANKKNNASKKRHIVTVIEENTGVFRVEMAKPASSNSGLVSAQYKPFTPTPEPSVSILAKPSAPSTTASIQPTSTKSAWEKHKYELMKQHAALLRNDAAKRLKGSVIPPRNDLNTYLSKEKTKFDQEQRNKGSIELQLSRLKTLKNTLRSPTFSAENKNKARVELTQLQQSANEEIKQTEERVKLAADEAEKLRKEAEIARTDTNRSKADKAVAASEKAVAELITATERAAAAKRAAATITSAIGAQGGRRKRSHRTHKRTHHAHKNRKQTRCR